MLFFRNLLQLFVAMILLGSCATSKTYLRNGQYDRATYKAAAVLSANKKKDKEILVLEEAFRIANNQDLEKIVQLKLEGNPANWESIYQLYDRINNRQQVVKNLLPLFIKKEFREAGFKMIDVNEPMAEAKNKTSEFLYASAMQLLQSGDKPNARGAYAKLSELKNLCGSYKDSDLKIREAEKNGKVLVGLSVSNQTKVVLPEGFEAEIRKINALDLNSRWVEYIGSGNETKTDFRVTVSLTRIDVTPERISDNNYKEQAKIQDGFIYSLDQKGNVRKDSLGNDIKIPKMITVVAYINETMQRKSCVVSGAMDIQTSKGDHLKSIPFSETVIFENYAARFTGDRRALGANTLRKIGGAPLPFPSDLKMISDASLLLKTKVIAALKEYNTLFLR